MLRKEASICRISVLFPNREIISLRSRKKLSGEPIFLTKNGAGAVVVVSMESCGQNRCDSMVCDKLRGAELQTASTSARLSHADVMEKRVFF